MNPFSDLPFDPEPEIEVNHLELSLTLATEELEVLRLECEYRQELNQSIKELEARRQQLESEFRRNPEQRTFTIYVTFTEREVRSIDFVNLEQLCIKRLLNALSRFRHESPKEFQGDHKYQPYGYNPTDPGSLGKFLGIPIPATDLGPMELDPEILKALLRSTTGPINKDPMKFRIGMDYSPKIIPNPGIIRGDT